ncbi:O-antigen ligase family protein [Fredinandcohnia onubensis]|uniref:O-antigen ligase family protein n=1 Tax=Fredinandcohnia onubensis TaxID=1571209 RepID=UPI000C0BFC30|nr:O-antigen ligase family protein [Fredinandcohnia onubensis]
MNIGFALKPYIILTFLNILLLFSITRFSKLLPFEVLMIFFILVYCASALQFNYPDKHLRFIFAFFIILLFYFSTRGLIIICKIEDLQKMISISGIIGSSASLVYYLIGIIETGMNFYGNGVIYHGLMIDRSIPRLIGTASGDPNIFVLFMTLYFFYYLYNISTTRNKIGFLLTTMCIILTFSRGAYIAIFITFLLMFIFGDKRKGKFKNLLVISLIFIGIGYVINLFGVNYMDFIGSRFSNISNDGGSGRITLWTNAIETFKNNPIMGIGLNGTLDYNTINYGSSVYIHNTMLEVLSESGLMGFIVFILLWISILIFCIRIFKYNKTTKFLLATFVATFIQMLSLSILLNEVFYLMLLLLYRYSIENIKNE